MEISPSGLSSAASVELSSIVSGAGIEGRPHWLGSMRSGVGCVRLELELCVTLSFGGGEMSSFL